MTSSTLTSPKLFTLPADLAAVLGAAEDGFESGVAADLTMRNLEADLQRIRSTHEPGVWRTRIVPAIKQHRVMSFLLQDPFTYRSSIRPRGYPGDAELLDMVYFEPERSHNQLATSPLGRDIFAYTTKVPASQAIRDRKTILADNIDRVLAGFSSPRILSIACGHLRELGVIKNSEQVRTSEFIALDQDTQSLQTAALLWPDARIRYIASGVKRIPFRDLGLFDLVYAAGLYDYLPMEFARSLTQRLVSALKPGGTLLVANFLRDVWESGYMEGVMDWWLLQRSVSEIHFFADAVPSEYIQELQVSVDKNQRIGYLTLVRA